MSHQLPIPTSAATSLPFTYTEALGFGFPGVKVQAIGDGSDYGLLSWVGGEPMPTKDQLDSWIANETRQVMWRRIQVERDRRRQNGVKIGTNWFHSDDTSRIQQIGLLLMGASMPSNIMWKTLGGGFVPMTPTLAQQIFQSVGAQDMTLFAIAEQHKAQMWASPNPIVYNFSTGWPPTFGE